MRIDKLKICNYILNFINFSKYKKIRSRFIVAVFWINDRNAETISSNEMENIESQRQKSIGR